MTGQTITELLLDDFAIQYFPLSKKTVSKLSHGSRFHLLLLLDCLLCHLVICPLVVMFWRGVWGLATIYLDEEWCGGDKSLSNAIALAAGISVDLTIRVFHHELRSLAGKVGTVRFTLFCRCFSFVWGFFWALLFRGIWEGITVWVGKGVITWEVCTGCLLVGSIFAIFSRTMRSDISPPTGMGIDLTEAHVSADTLLGTTRRNKFLNRLLDGVLSVCVCFGKINAWYGVFGLEDILLLENNLGFTPFQSGCISAGFGFVGGILLLFLQIPLLKIAAKYREAKKDNNDAPNTDKDNVTNNTDHISAPNTDEDNVTNNTDHTSDPKHLQKTKTTTVWICSSKASKNSNWLSPLAWTNPLPVSSLNVLFILFVWLFNFSSFRGVWLMWDGVHVHVDPTVGFLLNVLVGGLGLMVVGSVTSLHAIARTDDVIKNGSTVSYYYTSYYYIERLEQSQSQEDSS